MKANIVLTGFEPFNNRSINASYEVISKIENLRKYLLPVAFNKVEEKIDEILKTNPDVLILTGEAASYNNMTLEKEAHNIAFGKDNDGVIKNDEIIKEDGKDTYITNIDINNIKDIDFNVSTSAGKYLCNYTYYLSLYKTQNTNTKVIFIHFPLIKEQGGEFELDDLVNRLNSIVGKWCI